MGKRRIVGLGAAGAAILVGLYRLLNAETRELDEAARSKLGGSFIRLSAGVVHYVLEGSVDGQVVVLLHGGFTPWISWMRSTSLRLSTWSAIPSVAPRRLTLQLATPAASGGLRLSLL